MTRRSSPVSPVNRQTDRLIAALHTGRKAGRPPCPLCLDNQPSATHTVPHLGSGAVCSRESGDAQFLAAFAGEPLAAILDGLAIAGDEVRVVQPAGSLAGRLR